jgi:glycosyltransferase involved in cell wall biosynthesis
MRLTERALRLQGIEVETATTDDDGPGTRNGKHCCVPLKEHDMIRRYFPKRLEFYKVSPGFARWINRHVQDYDLVHIHALFSFTSVAAAWAARSAGIPYLVRPLGTLNRYGIEKRRPWLKRLSLKFIEGPILRHAAAVHFTAEAEKTEAESLGIPMRSVVIPLGVEAESTTPAGAAKAPAAGNTFLAQHPQLAGTRIVLYLSRLDPKKNVEGLLKAFSLVCKPDPENRPFMGGRTRGESAAAYTAANDLVLVVAGEGTPAYVASLHKLARKLGLGEQVLWVGHIGGDVKAGALAAAKVFALPSFSENFGIAAAEALLAGLPCVLGKGVALADDVAGAGAGLAVSPEPEEIARALRETLDDEGRRTEMGRRAAELAKERYSLEAMGARLHALYNRILSKEPVAF